MKRAALLALLVVSCARAPRPAPVTELEGVWMGTVDEKSGEKATLHFAGERFRFQGSSSSDWLAGRFAVEPLARPAKLDLHVEEGDDDLKGKELFAVYRLDGDLLSIAAAKPGTPRPLAVAADRRVVVFQLRRAPAR